MRMTLLPQVPMIETATQLVFNDELRRALGLPKGEALLISLPEEEED